MDSSAYSTAHIGRKVRELRTSLGLTQAALAGDRMTRNMLSCIENGSALPSVETLLYLAGRLNVCVAYLFSSGAEDEKYRKLASVDAIRLLYSEKKYDACLSVCRELQTTDAEIASVITLCEFQSGEACRLSMHLASAASHYKHLVAPDETALYVSGEMRERASFWILLMEHATDALLPEFVFQPHNGISPEQLFFLRTYTLCRSGQTESAAVLRASGLIPSPVYQQMLEASFAMGKSDWLKAIPPLHAVLANRKSDFFLQYHALEDLETCCEAMENYKDAYALSKRRMMLNDTFQK